MRTFKIYFVFFISMMAMTLAEYNEYEDICQEILEIHNEYRAKHNAGSLTLDRKLSKDAEKIAEADGIQFSLDHDKPIGYNIFRQNFNVKLNARNVINTWYEQKKNYSNVDDINMQKFNKKSTSAFTQIVWKSTQKLGFAVYPGKHGYYIIVVTYFPAGNIEGKYLENVEPNNDRIGESSNTSGDENQTIEYQPLSSE